MRKSDIEGLPEARGVLERYRRQDGKTPWAEIVGEFPEYRFCWLVSESGDTLKIFLRGLERSKQVIEAYLKAAEQDVDEGAPELRGFTAYYDPGICVKVVEDRQRSLGTRRI